MVLAMFRKILNILNNNEDKSVQQIAFTEVKHGGQYCLYHCSL